MNTIYGICSFRNHLSPNFRRHWVKSPLAKTVALGALAVTAYRVGGKPLKNNHKVTPQPSSTDSNGTGILLVKVMSGNEGNVVNTLNVYKIKPSEVARGEQHSVVIARVPKDQASTITTEIKDRSRLKNHLVHCELF